MQRLEGYKIPNDLEKSHDEWCNIAEEITQGKSIRYHGNMSLTIAEMLYGEALIATRNLKANSSKAMKLIQNIGGKLIEWQGIYLGALVNNECLEDLIVDVEGISFIGYRLNKGRITIDADSGDYIGLNAEGTAQMQNNAIIRGSFGMSARGEAQFINDGEDVFSMGDGASERSFFMNKKTCLNFGPDGNGAMYINDGDADTIGDSALDGFYLNRGRTYSFGPRTLGGLYINEGTVDGHMGFQAIKGAFVPRKNPKISLFERASLSNIQLVGHVINAQAKRIEAPNNSWKRAEKSIQDAREIKELIRISYPKLMP